MIDESVCSMDGIITKENWNFRWETYPWTTMSTTDSTRILLGFKPKLLSENLYRCTVHLDIIALHLPTDALIY
jgi:hypothetical protein